MSDLSRQLEDLAEAILPLSEWINRKPYIPPNAHELPWRRPNPPVLPLHELSLLPFVAGLINESSGDEELRAYFSTRAEEPLALAPHDDVAAWRMLRGLSPSPTFGVSESDNLLMDVDGHPISRASFYRTYLSLFDYACQAADAASAGAGINWKEFGSALLNNRSPFWPKSLPRRSSTFVKQFGRDVLYAVLGMRNPVPDVWRYAVLTELGEHRRVGNAFLPADAAVVIERFQAVFDPLFDKKFDNGGPAPVDIKPSMFAPVGSPPVTPREQQV